MRIPETTIEQIKDRVDIVQVVGRSVQLKKAGRNHVGLCPFHSEKSPSFNVSPDRRIFHCFGCGEGGDVFKFVSKLHNRPFPEVVRELGREVGIEVAEREETPQEKEAARWRERLWVILERAMHFYIDQLVGKDGAPAREYLSGRGLKESDWATFEIGYGSAAWDSLWTTLGKTDEDKESLLKAGLCVTGDRGTYDRFAGRIVFPIRDDKMRVIGFGGRVFGERARKEGVAKYVNTSESPVYDKSAAMYRWPQALQKARKGTPLVVVEGYFDAIALERCGLAVVATCGTALTPRHGQMLQKLPCPVVMCWDGDAAGERAVQRAAQVLLPLTIDTRVAVLPPGDDPDTYVERVGVAAGERLVAEAEPLPDWVIAQAARAAEDAEDDVASRVKVIRSLAWLFQALPPGLERDLYLEKAASKLGLARDQLARELKATPAAPRAPDQVERNPTPPHVGDAPAHTSPARRAPPPRQPPRPAGPPPLPAEDKTIIQVVMEHPDRAPALDEHPLAVHLSPRVRTFLAFVRDKVQEHGPFSPESPLFASLRDTASHPEMLRIHEGITRGHRLFADENVADRALDQLFSRMQLNLLRERHAALMREASEASARGDTEVTDRLRGPLRDIKDAIRALERGGSQPPGPPVANG